MVKIATTRLENCVANKAFASAGCHDPARMATPSVVVIPFFWLLKSFHLLASRNEFTERIIHYRTDCGWEHSSFDVSITLEQCYFGQCWAVDVPV